MIKTPRAALFTRRSAVGKRALGDTNAELSMPPVNPRRERMEDPYDTGDARVQQTVPVQARTSDRVRRVAMPKAKSKWDRDDSPQMNTDGSFPATDAQGRTLAYHMAAAGNEHVYDCGPCATINQSQEEAGFYDKVVPVTPEWAEDWDLRSLKCGWCGKRFVPASVQASASRVARPNNSKGTKIEIIVRPGTEAALLPLLEDLQLIGGWGASRNVIIDDFTDEGSKDREKFGDGRHYFDGDGADQIWDIKVTKAKETDEGPEADKEPKGGDPENHRTSGGGSALADVMEEHEDDPGFEPDAFWDYCVAHNRADCDSGELDLIDEDEIHRLFDAFMAEKRKKKADVQMHRTPPKGAPRPAQRTHLDEDLKDEMDPKTEDPDLVRHTRTGRLFP